MYVFFELMYVLVGINICVNIHMKQIYLCEYIRRLTKHFRCFLNITGESITDGSSCITVGKSINTHIVLFPPELHFLAVH